MVKLIYRGQSYESLPTSVSIDAKPVILSYRGVKFEYQPQSAPLSYTNQNSQKAVNLIYRGQISNLSQSEQKVKYRGAEASIPLLSICSIKSNLGLKYRGAMY